MDGNIKLSATVISCIGNDSKKDDFYFNGNFSNCHNTQSIQCSFEKYSNNYVFAISDSIGLDNGEMDSISAIREIKRYHESAKKNQFSLETITERIYEAVQVSSNLIYSKSIIANQNSSVLTGFSSMIIDNNRFSIMNLGNNGVFLYRQGEQKEIFNINVSKKNEKLKMLGITPKEPEVYNDTEKILKLAEEESKTKIKLSSSIELEEGDVIILCSDGLLNGVNKARIESVVDSGFEPSKMASILFQEATKNGMNESVTIMVIRVDDIKNGTYSAMQKLPVNEVEYENDDEEQEETKKESSVVNYILGFLCVLVISSVLFMGYLIVKNSGFMAGGKQTAESTQTSTLAAQTSSDATVTEEQDSSAQSDEETVEASTSKSDNQTAQQSPSKTSKQPATDSPSKTSKQPAKASSSKSDSEPAKASPSTSEKSAEQPGANQNQGTGEYEVHVVKAGDTLSSISSKYYGSPNKYDAIIKYNGMKNENSLIVGQELKIPKLK